MHKNSTARAAIFGLALLGVGAAPAAAQDHEGHGRTHATPEQRVERRVDGLDKSLDLTDDQEQQIRRILEETARDAKARFDAARSDRQADREALRASMRTQFEETDQAIAGVLDDAQRQKYEALKAERRSHGMERGRRMKERAGAFMQDLDLTDQQQEQVRQVLAERRSSVRAWMEQHPDATRDERRAFMQEQFQKGDAAVEAILTPEQLEKYRARRDEMRERWQNREHKHGEGRPQRG